MSQIPSELANSLNKNISEFCDHSLGQDDTQNHCAHYVSHMMGYETQGKTTCKNQTWVDKKKKGTIGALIRVDEIFNVCVSNGLFSAKPASFVEGLIFVTIDTNVKKNGNKLSMGTYRKKHIGIYDGSKVWHYGNTQDKVYSDPLATFKSKYTKAYKTKGSTVEFYYGDFL